ncbi:PhzF family phenazine biosynthesis protein [Lysinibacillus macroides]|uniref:PhzF family phenazine biosynthesis protein n=1 Tax=Lysinibacillus macroides TaxID=33935 RepID=UPI00137934D9|nr:PhzF family phenazine biosynthesis protein [Lysinibacillus macroides]QPR69351.1 PhzF family phenazine biosynthesis protein [Lysinibacillus macroides]
MFMEVQAFGTLIIPIKELSSFSKMTPNPEEFSKVLVERPTASVHPISFEVRDHENDLHGRHFSSPYSETIEDASLWRDGGIL